ncbi:MAG TPA: amidohydrolase family protein [Gaiellaceae bacterium]|jgi:predicted TIM-barrel fold metal-dependent hydrolase|nr:amidohydrolase family protein [Gaiellaceae bacterium]
MPRFDVHQHLYPPSLIDALRARRETPRLDGDRLELREGSFPFDARAHDLDARLAVLDESGIDVAVISLPPTLETEEHPELEAAYNEGIAALAAAADGRLRALAAGACLDGFAGVCVSAEAVVRGLGELPGELAAAGQALFVHPGPPAALPPGAPPWWAAVVDYPAQMQAAYLAWLAGDAQRHPALAAVFAILAGGGPFQFERLQLRGPGPPAEARANAYLDTSSYGPRSLELCRAACGAGRLVFGSDFPVLAIDATLQAVADLGDDAVDAVVSDNPARLFP